MPRNCWTCRFVRFSSGKSSSVVARWACGENFPFVICIPRKSILGWAITIFLAERIISYCMTMLWNCWRSWACSFSFDENKRISSMYTKAVWRGGLNIRSNACWNRDGAVLRPKGKTFHWRCRFGRQNAVLYLSSGWTPSCQNPDLRSNFENIVAPWRCWSSTLLFGSGNLMSCRYWFNGL